jgi:hypothetical protein
MSEETISSTSSSSSEAEQTSEVTFDTQQFGEILVDLDQHFKTNESGELLENHQSSIHQASEAGSDIQQATMVEATLPNGTKIMIDETAQQKSDEEVEFVQLTSSERIKLSQKDRTEVVQDITRKQHPLFKKMNLGMTDMDELVSLQTGLETAERHFAKYDLLQVFQIVTPDRNTNGKILPSLKAGSACRNLFQWYPVVTLDDVLASNAWYKTFPTDPWYTENMNLTYEYLKNHMEYSLFNKINEEYRSYPSSSQGGPLLLFLMIRHLIVSNSSVAESLSKQIDSVRISSYTGEDVGKVVTHLRGIIARLKNMRRKDQNGNEIDLVPFDLTKRLYRVFQTSSCEEFNSFFKDKSRQEYSLSKTGEGTWSDPEAVLALAESFYIDLNADNMWNGVDQNKATFPAISTPHDAVAFLSQVRCHNCGGSHYLRDCTAPKDQGRIAANKKILSKARKLAKKEGKQDSKDSTKDSKSPTSTSKWPPRPGRGENNRRRRKRILF